MVDRLDVYPFEIDLLLWAHDGPRWEVSPFANREGWLMIAVASRETPIGALTATLAVAVTDHGEPLSYAMADKLLDMPTSLPRDPCVEPPEALAEAMDGRYWDFLGRTDLECLAELAEAQERNDRRIASFEAECAAFEAKLWAANRDLRMERRRHDATAERIAEIDARLRRLLEMPDELVAGARAKVRDMRMVLDDFEAAIFDTLGEEGELAIISIARWRGRTGRRSDVASLSGGHDTLRNGLPPSADQRLAVKRTLVRGKEAHLQSIDRIGKEIARIRKTDEKRADEKIEELELEKQRILRRLPAYSMPASNWPDEQEAEGHDLF